MALRIRELGQSHSYSDPPMLYKDEAVVLRTMRLGEADRIVTFVGRGQGKIRAVA
ncbi:MAG: Recombination protein terminal, partial [Actinobacteria bacterium]|nr:Recombination protein terminal [Actinomycetota bacterium]